METPCWTLADRDALSEKPRKGRGDVGEKGSLPHDPLPHKEMLPGIWSFRLAVRYRRRNTGFSISSRGQIRISFLSSDKSLSESQVPQIIIDQ